MMRKSTRYDKKDADPDTERGLFARIAEDAILFAVACFLLKLGVGYLLTVQIPLIIIAVIAGSAVIGYRTWQWRKRHDDY